MLYVKKKSKNPSEETYQGVRDLWLFPVDALSLGLRKLMLLVGHGTIKVICPGSLKKPSFRPAGAVHIEGQPVQHLDIPSL